MSFSLAECLLGRYRPRPKREADSDALPGRAVGEASVTAAPVGYSEEVSELRRLLGDIAGGWTELVNSIQELREALQPEDLRTALEALGLDESILSGKPGSDGSSIRDDVEESPRTPETGRSLDAAGDEPDSSPQSEEAQERLESLLKLVREKLSSIESATSDPAGSRGDEHPERSSDAT